MKGKDEFLKSLMDPAKMEFFIKAMNEIGGGSNLEKHLNVCFDFNDTDDYFVKVNIDMKSGPEYGLGVLGKGIHQFPTFEEYMDMKMKEKKENATTPIERSILEGFRDSLFCEDDDGEEEEEEEDDE